MAALTNPSGADPVPGPARVPAPDRGVHETIAAALAALREPDLGGFPPADVEAALTDMYGQSTRLRPEYRDRLYQRVQELSFGMTRMVEAGPADAAVASKDFTSSYHRLTGLFAEQIVIIQRSRPYVTVVAPR